MNFLIKVKPRAKQEKIEKREKEQLTVYLKELPRKGRANKAMIRALANYFQTPQANIKIIKGVKSQNKIIQLKK